MNTLFRKDSVLFISIDGKEYEVGNPEEPLYIEKQDTSIPAHRLVELLGEIQWIGGVELYCNADCPDHQYGSCCHPGHCQKKVRLLPKEEKKGNNLSKIGIASHGPVSSAMSYSEGDYKQFEGKREPCAYEEECQHPACNCGKMIEPFKKECPKCRTKDFASCHSMNCPVRKPVESSEPQEKYKCADCGAEMNEGERNTFTVCDTCFDKHYSQSFLLPKAPVESQEEMWKAVMFVIKLCKEKECDPVTSLSGIFSITRLTP